MCMAANVPLVESGTAGYLGQVQPILKVRRHIDIRHHHIHDRSDRIEQSALIVSRSQHQSHSPSARSVLRRPNLYTASYGRRATSSRKQLTISSVWYSRLASDTYSQLFGEDEDGGELDEAEKQGENGE